MMLCCGQMDEYEGWLNKQLEKQKKLKAHETPAFKSADVDAKLADVRKLYTKLKAKKQPKPPKPAAAANDTAATADEKGAPSNGEGTAEQEDVRLEEGSGEDGSAAKDEL